MLKEVAPDIKRVPVILFLDSIRQLPILRAIEAAAPVFGVPVEPGPRYDFSTAAARAAIERDIITFAQEPNGGLIVFFGMLDNRDLILGLAARHRLRRCMPVALSWPAAG